MSILATNPEEVCTVDDLSGYFLLGLLSSFVFRAVRDALPNNPVAQERIIGAAFLALGIADVSLFENRMRKKRQTRAFEHCR